MAALNDIVTPSLTFEEILSDGSTLTNPAADGRRLFLGEDGLFHMKDSAGAVTDVGGGGGLSSGTSNPGSPSDGDLFYRSDLNIIIRYFSSGTRWTCTCPHDMAEGPQTALVPLSANTSIYLPVPSILYGTGILLTSLNVGCFVVTTNTGANYWTFTVSAPAWTGANFNTSANAANTELIKRFTTPFAWTFNAAGWMEIQMTKTGAPGTLYHMASYSFNYIVT